MSARTTSDRPARGGMFAALANRNYRIYVSGSFVSNIGTWMQRVAQDWLVLELSGGSGVAIGITGISPESEPSPARLAEVTAQVRELGVSTIFTEPLLPSGIAETVAQETGAAVLTLDPVEGITETSAGSDYLEVMRANLVSLRDGLGCA